MKTPTGRQRSRYRNEAVFRSAQRLLSAQPPLPRTSTPTQSFFRPRAFILLLVAAGLFAAGLVVGLRWDGSRASEPAADAPPVDRLSDSPAAEASTPAPGAPSPETLQESPRKAPSSATHKTQRARPGDGSQAAAPAEIAASAAARSPKNATASVLSNGDAATSTLVQTTVVLGAEVTIRGQLTTASSPPLDFEFSLRRKDAALTGVVRYLTPNGKRVVANTVQGEITEGRHVDLRETGTAWTVSGTSPRFLHEFRPHRNFVFELPPQTTAKDEFSGYWNSHIRHDTASGYLTLWFAAPW